MRNQIVILAAGKGKRMGINMPKVLVMAKNKPLILYLLEEVEKISQLAKPVIVVGYKHKQVMDVLGEDYTYAIQKEQLGTAHALLAAKPKVKSENVLVLYGDMPLIKAESLKELLALHFKSGSNVSMLTSEVADFNGQYKSLESFGRIIRKPDHSIVGVVEYKDATDEQKQIKEINPGIYVFKTKWLWENLKKIKNKNNQKEYYLTDIIHIAVSSGQPVKWLRVDPIEVLGVNSPDDLKYVKKLV